MDLYRKIIHTLSATNRKKRRILVVLFILIGLVLIKLFSIYWSCHNHGDVSKEKKEILQRRNYLIEEVIVSPKELISKMPSCIEPQFKSEWAIYSYSMLSAALTNISKLYPETVEENKYNIAKIISFVLTPEMRKYDTIRWGNDALQTLHTNESHLSYLSILALMICEYKEIGGGDEYDKYLSTICEAMNRRILAAPAMNLQTYPYEPVYIPDMLVAIVALKKYSDLHNGEYTTTVRTWIERAKREWCDDKTGLLMSTLSMDGSKIDNPRGSFNALSCSYLTYIDEEFARDQYEKFKQNFWKSGVLAGVKEHSEGSCYFGMDVDAGPIIFGLSPSGTVFAIGAATYFNDNEVRNGILRTAEIIGNTIITKGKQHYLLSNFALVGESAMLALRTNYKNANK